MNDIPVKKVVQDIGSSYFYDEVSDSYHPDPSVLKIFGLIKDDIAHSKITGEGFWEKREEGLRIALQGLSESEFDVILRFTYNLDPEAVGGSKSFFERLYSIISDAIAEARRRQSP